MQPTSGNYATTIGTEPTDGTDQMYSDRREITSGDTGPRTNTCYSLRRQIKPPARFLDARDKLQNRGE